LGTGRKQKLDELDRMIERMRAAGNVAGEAMARGQKALVYATSGDLSAAAGELAKVSALAEEEGRVDELALAQMARGKALTARPADRTQAVEALNQASALFHVLENRKQEAEALKELAVLDVIAGDLSQAEARFSRAIELLENVDEQDRDEQASADLIINLLRLRSRCHVLQKDPDAALADLNAALALAGQREALALPIRVERRTVQKYIAEGATPEQLADLLRDAYRQGDIQVIGDVQLQQAAEALGDDNYRQALALAQEARQAARDAGDLNRFVRYLLASLVIAEAQEGLGDRPAVLAALLTCKVYLETHLGPAVGRHVDLLLDTLEERWGRGALAEAVREYRRRVEEHGPYQV
jgi:tetratricopeptide (TPR) repeat protein